MLSHHKTFQCMNVVTGEHWTYKFIAENAGIGGVSWNAERGLKVKDALQLVNNWNRIASLQNITKNRYWLD